jgi:hypothetical protein
MKGTPIGIGRSFRKRKRGRKFRRLRFRLGHEAGVRSRPIGQTVGGLAAQAAQAQTNHRQCRTPE